MKKNILWALIALFAATFEGAAQNNSYNMVITMANGTTISIGPNEVKNISFNDGKVEMTGQTLDQLVERVEKLENRPIYDDQWIKYQFWFEEERMDVLEDSIKNFRYQLRYQLDPIRKSIVDVDQDLRDKIHADSAYLKNLIDDSRYTLYNNHEQRIKALEEALKSREVKSATKKEDE